MLPPVYATLKASPVDALTGGRIYRHGTAPQDTPKPYVTWFLLSGTPENQLSGLPSGDRMTVQVDCWTDDDDDAEVEDLAQAVRDAIEPHAHMTSMPIDDWEPATRLYRMALQFDWIQSRPGP